MPKVLISHSHKDEELAKSLVEFVRSALDLPNEEILCTSVPGTQLAFGSPISEQLRDNISLKDTAVIAILTPESLSSGWVLFELGASWALKRTIVPILAPGLVLDALPGPLPEYLHIRIDTSEARYRLTDAIKQISKSLGVDARMGGEVQAKLDEFIRAFTSWKPILPAVEIAMGPPLPPLENILRDVSRDWIVTYIGDVYLMKLENVFNSIQKHKRIESGYAYWGIGPAVNWKAACDDQ